MCAQSRSKPVSITNFELTSNQRVAILLVMVVLVVVGLVSNRTAEYEPIPNLNSLKLGEGSLQEPQLIPPVSAISFDGVTRESIYRARKEAVLRHAPLVEVGYEPSGGVFGRLKDAAPWFSTEGFFVRGASENSVRGLAYLSQSILSPYELAVPTFWGLSIWGEGHLQWKNTVLEMSPVDAGVPLQPRRGALLWDAPRQVAQTTYHVSEFLRDVSPFLAKPLDVSHLDFGVSLFNARDFNLKYVYLDTASSDKIRVEKQKERPHRISEHFFFSKSVCGSAQGCNHIRNQEPQLDTIAATQLPAKATFKFWRFEPEDVNALADFVYTIYLE